MATTVSYQNYGAANVIIATENAANISIAINYVPYIANISNAITAMSANIAFIASNIAQINANVGNISTNSSASASVNDYLSSLVTQITTLTTKISSIESIAVGDHGIHVRQPHQWQGGSSTFTSNVATPGTEPQATTITISNVSE